MFSKGNQVGPIQPYFLSQINRSLAHQGDIASGPAADASVAQAKQTAQLIADFVDAAQTSLDVAIYDFRLNIAEIRDIVVGAFNRAAERGVAVRIAYDQDQEAHTPGTVDYFAGAAADPAPDGTNEFVTSDAFHPEIAHRGVTTEGIDPQHHIMHQKYILRDGQALLMGSANFTVDAWAAQENNILVWDAVADLVKYYANDFKELWETQKIGTTGRDDSADIEVGGLGVHVAFAPGQGTQVEGAIADKIASATSRLYVASMVISSGKILDAIDRALADVHDFGGLYDAGEMNQVEHAWEKAAETASSGSRAHAGYSSSSKLSLWNDVKPYFVAKHSNPYSDHGTHNFMHDKIAVADDFVITGSFNFSNNAMKNAENILIIESRELADQYADYIQQLIARYKSA